MILIPLPCHNVRSSPVGFIATGLLRFLFFLYASFFISLMPLTMITAHTALIAA